MFCFVNNGSRLYETKAQVRFPSTSIISIKCSIRRLNNQREREELTFILWFSSDHLSIKTNMAGLRRLFLQIERNFIKFNRYNSNFVRSLPPKQWSKVLKYVAFVSGGVVAYYGATRWENLTVHALKPRKVS